MTILVIVFHILQIDWLGLSSHPNEQLTKWLMLHYVEASFQHGRMLEAGVIVDVGVGG